ncbi:hypothetical protein A2160_02885 [Candidatus Beckwithbacteria bacterium RBG_13_42_9]|uniref:Glycosyltransferase RgtA/B/C/D-like domain-containing protein n=1 Tax=Candidatus Beckwithbacteria bacterium RBG_13_42_9 TaxID=1797457 RepID=A0A1F5E7L6_9BACT|nr:MAG: hypothetical protein A2160_02885 [Candidatus Beckwithbacteria bacterium RBG_13_42_9]
MKIKRFFRKEILFLLLILGFSFFLRLADQPNFPACLHRDEVQFGYNAYSLLKTGRDEWGQFLPTHFRYNGEYHVPVVFYLIASVMFFTGPTDLSIRLPAIIIGSLIPILAYLLIKEIFKDKKLALIFALLLSFNPWEVINARASGEISIISLFLGILGFYLLSVFIRNKHKLVFFLAVTSLVLAYLSYIASRLNVPIMLIIFLVIFFKEIPFKKLILPILGLVICLPFLLVALYPQRFVTTSIVAAKFFPDDVNQRKEAIIGYKTNKVKFILNRGREFFFEFVDNYFDYLSPHYIFREMGEPDRTNIFQSGSLYLVEIITVIFGIYALLRSKNKKGRNLIILWFFAAPIVGALTFNYPDKPNSARTVYFYFILSFLSAYGVYFLLNFSHRQLLRKVILMTLISAFLVNGFFIYKQVRFYTNQRLAPVRDCGYPEVFQLTESLKSQFPIVYFGTVYEYPYIHYLWQTKYSPEKYHEFLRNNPSGNDVVLLNSPNKHDWQLENYVFKHRSCLVDRDENVLMVAKFTDCKDRYQIKVMKDFKTNRLLFLLPPVPEYKQLDKIVYQEMGEIKRTDGSTVFNLYTYNKNNDNISAQDMKDFVQVN